MKKMTLLVAGILSFVVLSFGARALAADTAIGSACEGIGKVAGENGCVESTSSPSVRTVVSAAVTILSYIIGIASIIMILVGSFKYITSAGDSAKVGNAKTTIMYALIGLVVAALSMSLVRFVLHQATSTPPTVVEGASR